MVVGSFCIYVLGEDVGSKKLFVYGLGSFSLVLLLLAFQNFSTVQSPAAQVGPNRPEYNNATYQNPLSTQSCADPAVFYDSEKTKKFYLACSGGRFPIRVSDDAITWKPLGKSIVTSASGLATWAETGRSWAPALGKVGDHYVGYYTQNILSDVYNNSYSGRTNLWGAIGVSSSTDIERENFKEPLTVPIVRDDVAGGIIDPSLFVDPVSGQPYLLYKPDSNGIFKNTSILIRPLGPKGLGFTGPGTVIQRGGSQIESLIEGPEMIMRNGYYYLFFSSGSWAQTSYRVYVVRSKNILGPYEGKRLVLSGRVGGKFEAPGHGSIMTVNQKDYYVYHAWDRDRRALGRLPMLDRIFWFDGWPIINNGHPSEGAQYTPLADFQRYHKVVISWKNPGLEKPLYSFDIKLPSGEILGPCISAGVIKETTSLQFRGTCTSLENRKVGLTNRLQYRICGASGGRFKEPAKVKCSPFQNIKTTELGVYW